MFTPTSSVATSRKAPLASSGNAQHPIAVPGDGTHVQFPVDGVAMVQLLGPQDHLLKAVERQHPLVELMVRGNVVTLIGDAVQVEAARRLIEELVLMVKSGREIDGIEIVSSDRMLHSDATSSPAELLSQAILTSRGKSIRPKTLGQKQYVDAIDEYTIVFGIGPAGTGKTFLAMAKAVQALQRKEVERIILTRPAVEAGEHLGYLPGTLTDKIDPYVRPLYDALNEMMDPDVVLKLIASGTIEVAPLAYMRGRTLNNSFIVLDEAQNTTPAQMKMFLTRLGHGSQIVVTGDITQVDLPNGASGLQRATKVLDDIDDIHFALLTSDDVVRHSLVGTIIDAYTRYDAELQAKRHENDQADSSNRADGRSGRESQSRQTQGWRR